MCGACRQESPPPRPVYDECVRTGQRPIWRGKGVDKRKYCPSHESAGDLWTETDPLSPPQNPNSVSAWGRNMRRYPDRRAHPANTFSFLFLSVQMLEGYSSFDIDTGDGLVISYLFHDFEVQTFPASPPVTVLVRTRERTPTARGIRLSTV